MRTTLDIPEPLIEEARQALGFKSKTDTVVLALKELIRRRRLEELKSLMGKVRLDLDLSGSRRRPPRRRARSSSIPRSGSRLSATPRA
jgi:Arc/MetJ family transcription regulator